MRYEDFSVHFGLPRDGEHEVSVERSPAGQGRGTFRIPFSEDELRELQQRLGRFVRASVKSRSESDDEDGGEPAPSSTSRLPDPGEIGSRLFQALFTGEVERLLDLSLAKVEEESRGLRIQLHLPAGRKGFAPSASLPWEVLYWPRRGRFLARGRELSVVRFLEIPQPPHSHPLELPLRILAVASRAGEPPLNVEEECRNLARACEGMPQVQVTFLPEATPNALRRQLHGGRFHGLHFMGHGAFNRATGEGALLFEREGGGTEPLPAVAFADLVRDFRSLRLVLLTACDSARLDTEGLHVYGGVASALLHAGLPAVVAMQYRISDAAAVLFSEAFYRRLAAGDPVDAATAEGRMAIYLRDTRSAEWATPVLFSRVPDGRLFESPPRTEPDAVTGPAAALVLPRVGLPPAEDLDVYRLLHWESGLAERLVGRDGEKAELLAWAQTRSDPERPRVRFLIGPGGSGKTRLAFEVAQTLQGSGWTAGFAPPKLISLPPVPTKGLFVVVDYPEERRDETAELLLSLSAIAAPAVPIRILLCLARSRSATGTSS